MRTATYKVDVASDRRGRENVPRHILFAEINMDIVKSNKNPFRILLWVMRLTLADTSFPVIS